jgi:hypothetical protein
MYDQPKGPGTRVSVLLWNRRVGHLLLLALLTCMPAVSRARKHMPHRNFQNTEHADFELASYASVRVLQLVSMCYIGTAHVVAPAIMHLSDR